MTRAYDSREWQQDWVDFVSRRFCFLGSFCLVRNKHSRVETIFIQIEAFSFLFFFSMKKEVEQSKSIANYRLKGTRKAMGPQVVKLELLLYFLQLWGITFCHTLLSQIHSWIKLIVCSTSFLNRKPSFASHRALSHSILLWQAMRF